MKVLVTAGPTREAIDPVRFVSNRSSGKMGYAVAAAARKAGHAVRLISGPVAIAAPRGDISDFAPRIHTMKIDPKKIKDVIGKGGAVIRSLTEETGTSIDIADDGTVKIAATENAAAKAVMVRIEDIVADVEVNRVYNGKVTRIADFGAFVAIVGNKEGLVHISQIAEERVEKVTDYLQVGQEVAVRVVEIDRQGRIRLTMRDINNGSAAANSSEELVTEDDQA